MAQETGTIDMGEWEERRTVEVSFSQPFIERPTVTLLPHRANVAVVDWGVTGFVFQGVALEPGANMTWIAERITDANTA